MERLIVFLLVVGVLALLYLVINPLYSGRNTTRLAINDACAYGLCIAAVSFRYMDTGTEFLLFGIDLGWFWYTTLIYIAVEIPVFIWYAKRYNVRF